MYKNVLTDNKYTKCKVESVYVDKLNKMADKIVSNHRFGTKHRIDKLLFIKIKNLLNILRDTTDNRTIFLNQLMNVIRG